jgi:long-chain acyl-CoA synthetase
MRGYWNDQGATERTFADGWLKTGDLVTMDDDGYVTVLGRASTDFVKIGGHKVSTREIEERLATYPGIVEVSVVGAPDREWGQRVIACVVLAPGAARADLLERLQAHVQLPRHKLPRGLLIVEALDRNAMGKVQKKLLEQRAIAAGV